MHCERCGFDNQAGIERCQRCRGRLPHSQHGSANDFVQGAALPKIQPESPTRPILTAVPGGASPLQQRQAPPRQRDLFPAPATPVAQLDTYTPIRTRARSAGAFAELRPVAKRKAAEGQSAFDFNPARPPSGMARETEFQGGRAPWPARAAGVLADAFIVIVFTLLWAAAARQIMISAVGISPGPEMLPWVAGAALLIGIFYKVIWAFDGQVTPGMQAVRLDLAGFDGRRPDFAQRMTRLVVGAFGFAACGLGLLYAIVDRDGLCWHDSASQSFVSFNGNFS